MKTMKQGRYLLLRDIHLYTLHSDIVTITLAEHSDSYRMGVGWGGGVIQRNRRGTEVNRKESPWIPKGPPLIHSHLDY